MRNAAARIKRFFKEHPVRFLLLIGLVITLVAGGTAIAANYSLNKTITGKIVVSPTDTPPPGTAVTLYTESTCNTAISSPFTLDFGSVMYGTNTTVQRTLYFRTAEVNKDTVVVTRSPATYALTYTVDVVATTGVITFSLNTGGLVAGTYTFSITVTGSGS